MSSVLEAATSAPKEKGALHGTGRLVHVTPASAVKESVHAGSFAGPGVSSDKRYARVFVMRASSTGHNPMPAGASTIAAGVRKADHVVPPSSDCSTPIEHSTDAVGDAVGQKLVTAHTSGPMALTSSTKGPMRAGCHDTPSSWLTHSGAPPVERAPQR
jgi:hypothetical protein